MRASSTKVGLLALSVALIGPVAEAQAAPAPPPVMAVEFRPAVDDLQIAVWLEDTAGTFLQTAFITRAVGTFGIGNRPGEFDLKSGFRWPYGRRTNALPIWAHRHGKTYPLIVFEDGRDGSVAYHEEDSSPEAYFCRPTQSTEQYCYRSSPDASCTFIPYPLTSSQGVAKGIPGGGLTVDAITCPSVATLSKGRVNATGQTTVYPPRNDLNPQAFAAGRDDPSIKTYAGLNTLDAVSRATPTAARAYPIFVMIDSLADGDYVVQVEVNREFDQNMYHDYPDHPDDETIWNDFGTRQLGQPSVLYTLPITVQNHQVVAAHVKDYSGYGAWDGATGDVSPPDHTISTTDGTGAGRLAMLTDETGQFRVRAVPSTEILPGADGGPDGGNPGDGGSSGDGGEGDGGGDPCAHLGVPGLEVVKADPGQVKLRVTGVSAPPGYIFEYDLRYNVGDPVTQSTVDSATPGPLVPILSAGQTADVSVGGLKPQTHYYFAVRTSGVCGNSRAAFADVQTPRTAFTTLHGCFVATAAFGSPLAREVDVLRRVRDQYLLKSELGQKLVALYYATSPPLAARIAADEELRRVARGLLVPVVVTSRMLLGGPGPGSLPGPAPAPVGQPSSSGR
jgi:hypothetical protein